ncbi:T9SS type A sorting domain-containing protein [Winogradskyella sp. PE311]|uniref:T9SS type A sorting domain-containing protein n=1 Tax=Winogradskyella sp. PE311 TaxID=3366943 RepID=UPI0039808CD3
MKTKLLFAFLIVTQFMSAQYYISEIVVSPPNNSGVFNDYTDTPLVQDFEYAVDDTLEYFEFRGTPGATIPDDVYFIAIDGDDENPGRIQDAVELGGLTFGSNGILVIVSNMTFDTGSLDSDGTTDISGVTITNPYASALAASSASVLTIEFTGVPAWVLEGDGDYELDRFNGVSSVRGYDGTMIDQSATYMIIQTPAMEGNPDGEEIDSNADGILDGLATGWTIYDSVAILDDDDIGGTGEYAYSPVVFVEDPMAMLPTAVTVTVDPALSATIIPLNQYPQYFARQGVKTGNSVSVDGINNDDWMAGRINSRSGPDWTFSGTAERNFPTSELTGNSLSGLGSMSDIDGLTIGEINVDFSTLSSNDIVQTEFSVFPNPAKTNITIRTSDDTQIDSVQLYNIVGVNVLSTTNLVNDSIDVSNMATGVYLLKINSGSNSITRRVIIE